MENLKSRDFGASNFSRKEALENRAKDPITQGEYMGVYNSCLRFVGRRSLKLCLLHLHLDLQVQTGFQLHVLGIFRDRLCRLNLKEKNFWKEFGAKQLGLVKVVTK